MKLQLLVACPNEIMDCPLTAYEMDILLVKLIDLQKTFHIKK